VVPPEHGTGIHIVMDRTTGKTMDCYVEYLSVNEAQNAVNRLVYRGPQLRLGSPPQDRVVRVAMSSQDELMKQLFPRAKNVTWTDGKPVIHASNEPFNTGFKTFITGEELVMMTKHAEQPHRVSALIQLCF
jgi:RNA recognition motif-containing protein